MSKTRVVLIDDETGTANLIKMYLEMMGFDVAVGLNGAEGLEAIREHQPQVLVLDLMLPDMDGYDICARLRQQPATAELPILILSARTNKEDVKRGYAVGASLYLKKPVDLHRLVNEIRKAAERGRHSPPTEDEQEAHAAAAASPPPPLPPEGMIPLRPEPPKPPAGDRPITDPAQDPLPPKKSS